LGHIARQSSPTLWQKLICVGAGHSGVVFLAIVSFWITFRLATTGFERTSGGLHLGVFRAISDIRITGLLSVTSGTAVSFLFILCLNLYSELTRLFEGSYQSKKTAKTG
jgi:hypothetical protein